MQDDLARIVSEATIINQLFKARGLAVSVPCNAQRLPSHYLTPTTVVYDLAVPMGIDGGKLLAQQDDTLSYVRQFRRMNGITSNDESGMEIMPTVRIDRYEHTMEISRPQRDVLPWSSIKWPGAPMTAFCGLRYTSTGTAPVLWNMAKPDQPHGLIAGTTGSGKTNQLLSILFSLMLHNSPADLAVTVVDPKHSDGVQFLDNLPHVRTVARDLADAVHAISTFYAEMEQRERGIVPRDARHILAIEEAASLTEHPDVNLRKKILFLLADIARRCRENNMNLIICTQKPTADVLGDQLKSNLLMRLVGSVTSKDDANTAVQVKASGAEMLPGYGSFIYRLNRTMFRYQAPLIDGPAHLCRKICKINGEEWRGIGGSNEPVRTGSTMQTPTLTREVQALGPEPVQVVQPVHRFPLGDKRPLTYSEAAQVRTMADDMSKNQLCLTVYGAKSGRYMEWINEALAEPERDEKVIPLRRRVASGD